MVFLRLWIYEEAEISRPYHNRHIIFEQISEIGDDRNCTGIEYEPEHSIIFVRFLYYINTTFTER